METQLECPLTIQWEGLATEWQPRVIKAYTLASDFLTSTDEWSITLFDSDPERLRHLALEPLSLAIHGATQLFGRVERITRGNNGSEVTIRGRDHLSAMVECNIDPTVRVTEDMTLAQAVILAAGPCGIDEVFGESDVQTRNMKSGAPLKAGRDQGFPALDPGNLKPEPGMGVFEWLNRLAARQGCTIQPGPTRNSVVLCAPNYEQDAIVTIYRATEQVPGRRSNIVRGISEEDYSSFPTVGLATGKVAKTGEAAKSAAKVYDAVTLTGSVGLNAKIENRIHRGRVLPTDAPPDPLKLYRLLYVKDTEARKQSQVERALSRAMSERLRSTLTYECTVKGHKDHDSGYVFAIDTIAQVKDAVCDIDEELWVASTKFTYQAGSGATTDLVLWRPGSFVL